MTSTAPYSSSPTRSQSADSFYGPNVFETKVEREESKSRPGEPAWQVYMRSLGAVEGLR